MENSNVMFSPCTKKVVLRDVKMRLGLKDISSRSIYLENALMLVRNKT